MVIVGVLVWQGFVLDVEDFFKRLDYDVDLVFQILVEQTSGSLVLVELVDALGLPFGYGWLHFG